MYGTRDAAQNWGMEYIELMKDAGFERGKSNPCVFRRLVREIRCVVHGDDFGALGWKRQLDWFWNAIKKKLECKHRARLGPEQGDQKSLRILSRIVEWDHRGIQHEGDQRHVEISMQDTGVLEDSRGISTPTDKSVNKLESQDVPLSPEMASKHRGITARINYLGQDGSDIQFAVKELGRDTCPTRLTRAGQS